MAPPDVAFPNLQAAQWGLIPSILPFYSQNIWNPLKFYIDIKLFINTPTLK